MSAQIIDLHRDLPELVGVDLACNDPDTGNFAGRIQAITFPTGSLELSCHFERGPKLVELGDRIRVSGRVFPIDGSIDAVGNWCWNRYVMKAREAAGFMYWLRATGRFSADTGWAGLYDWWHDPEGWRRSPVSLAPVLQDAQRQALECGSSRGQP